MLHPGNLNEHLGKENNPKTPHVGPRAPRASIRISLSSHMGPKGPKSCQKNQSVIINGQTAAEGCKNQTAESNEAMQWDSTNGQTAAEGCKDWEVRSHSGIILTALGEERSILIRRRDRARKTAPRLHIWAQELQEHP